MVQISLRDAPSTAAMTTNITRFTMDVGDMLLGKSQDDIVTARRRVGHTWPAFVALAVAHLGYRTP